MKSIKRKENYLSKGKIKTISLFPWGQDTYTVGIGEDNTEDDKKDE